MKFKIQAGGEIDLLTKDELGGMLDDKIAEFDRTISEGIRYSKATISGLTTANLLTSANYAGGYTMLESARPEPGFVWQVSNITYFNFTATGADLFFNDPQPSNVVYAALANSGTTQVADNCFIVVGGMQIGIGFKAAVTNAAINLFYKEVPIRDIGKL